MSWIRKRPVNKHVRETTGQHDFVKQRKKGGEWLGWVFVTTGSTDRGSKSKFLIPGQLVAEGVIGS